MTTYYKLINADNKSAYGGTFDWTPYLPQGETPGEWTPAVEGEIVPCKNGYHVTDAAHLLNWPSAQLYECEVEEPVAHEDGDKWACRRARLTRKIEAWNDKTLRLFACWCVRGVWHLLTDEQSRYAVEVAEKYANGEATEDEWDAAVAAAGAAAVAAEWDAAVAAGGAAAGAAARAAAWAAAWDAAWGAARAAARAAAWPATWGATWDAQNRHLCEMLGIATEEEE